MFSFCLLLFTFSLLTFRFLIFFFLKSLLIDGLEWNIFTKKRFLALLLQRSDFSLFYYKEAISRSFITKKQFLALLLVWYAKKKSKFFIAFLDDLCQGDSESAKKNLKKSLSVPRSPVHR